jgi:phage baseplate assembly protein W
MIYLLIMAKTINIKFPFKDTYDGGVFASTITSEAAYQSDLISLLTTKRGQRVMRSKLYSPIYDYLMEPLDDITQQELRRDIDAKVREYIPQIEIKKIKFSPDYENNALGIKIIYIIKEFFSIEKTLELSFPTDIQ